MNCISCSRDTDDYPFRALEVLTLHVRDLNGEKRVQALGEFRDFCVCRSCAEEKLTSLLDRKGQLMKLMPYGLAVILGLVMLWFTRSNGNYRLLSLAVSAFGVLGILGTVKNIREKTEKYSTLSHEEALRQAAWECLIEHAPRKADINDITYIPVDEQTLARKNGDLMILYDLLPEIAVQAYDRIHGLEEPAEE